MQAEEGSKMFNGESLTDIPKNVDVDMKKKLEELNHHHEFYM
jgi:hypothetical protein